MVTVNPLERDLEQLKEELLARNVEISSKNLLPTLPTGFSVPVLPDRPQNPIMDTIKQARKSTADGPENIELLPPELRLLALDQGIGRFHDENRSPSLERFDVWKEALARNRGLKNRSFNWDGLRHGQYNEASTSKFLSEQDPFVAATARQQTKVQPGPDSAGSVYASKYKLFNALKLTILGTASVFHVWDENLERFVQSSYNGESSTGVLIDSMDRTISKSIVDRFMTIGTLLRRLEIFVEKLRKSSPKNGPTVFAFAHALSTVIFLLRRDLAKGPPTPRDPLVPDPELAATWMHYEIYEQTLAALSRMCGRDTEKSPSEYQAVNFDQVSLLDLIYNHLHKHICAQSPRFLTAVFAFILSTVSADYFRKLSHSIGYHTDAHHRHGAHTTSNVYLVDDGYELEALDDEDEEDDETSWDTFPDFLPPELLSILPAAQKSLTLLKAAQPNHPLLNHNTERSRIRWIWDHQSIESASAGDFALDVDEESSRPASAISDVTGDQFALFRVFDLEPGQCEASSPSSVTDITTLQELESFIDTFPETLPSVTPDLSHLTSLVMAPLVEHASTLAGALLTTFLTSSDDLNFRSHLVLLRSYLLVTGPQFRSRLSSALFSDSEDTHSDETTQQMSIKYLKRKPKSPLAGKAVEVPTMTWAMGLSPSLLERGEWPPVDADVRFFLRTVIVDSLDAERDNLEAMGLSAQVIQEGEYRLGFVPRLPSRETKVKWQDPLAIEALDFVYMTYRPPRPLEVLITPDIVAKYQRLFSFIVRLMRVEHALGSLFRISRKQFNQLFPTLVQSQRQLLHFRFVAQSFVSNLSRYVFDTAIGGNFDPFFEKLSATPEANASRRHRSGYTDVFSLANSHSEMLDNILSACMLRKAQHNVLDVLRSLLQTILDFCIKVGMRYRGQLEEYQAAPMLAEISHKFHTRMTFFVRSLRKIMDMDKDSSVPLSMQYTTSDVKESVGGAEALRHLLIRLDLGKWWITSKH